MNRRTDVVDETWKRQLRRARPAANGFSRFEDANGMTRPRNFNSCRKTVRAGAGNHRFEFHRRIVDHDNFNCFATPIEVQFGGRNARSTRVLISLMLLVFLPPNYTMFSEQALLSKLTERLIPYMFLLYIVSYLDRINV